MKRFFFKLTCLFLIFSLLSIPAMATEQEAIEPTYAPSTQEEARAIPLNLNHSGWKKWSTLYNPCTAKMAVELAKASRDIGKEGDWPETMEKYGYSQLRFTENNAAYSAADYFFGWRLVEDREVPVSFRAVNAIIGIQDVTYNGRTRHAVGIAFRGSSDLEDWMCDILSSATDEEGFHTGFSENAADFYNTLSKEISFTVNGESLTLYDIYDKMKTPDSDFCMLVMGHSLGGALTNMLVGKYLYEHGVHPSNLAGYGIAVPRTSSSSYAEDYPYDNIINIINCDDPVPHLTLKDRIGRDFVFYPDAEFRLSHYAKDIPEAANESTTYWRTIGTLKSGAGPHLLDIAYDDIVQIISDEIGASTPDQPSNYTNLSTSGYNNWGFLGDIRVSPYSFGNFEKTVDISGNLLFDEGVLVVHDDLEVDQGILMQNDNDYLQVWGDLKITHGMHVDTPDHLTAGTIELKGDLTTGNYSFYEYSYRATGTHRTVLSGTELQTLYFDDEDVRFENLYIRNPNVKFSRYVPYLRLAEDSELRASEPLTVWNLDLNGHTLVQNGDIYVAHFTMNEGTLQINGNVKIQDTQKVDGVLMVSGDLTHTETLPFGGGQVSVNGECYLPQSMIMQHPKDYLSVGKTLTVFTIEELPDDHLSAGTVEVKGDFAFEARGVLCNNNAYRETGSHRTILSGNGVQTLHWSNRAGGTNRLENLCIRNPNVIIHVNNDIRLGESGTIKVDSTNQNSALDLGGILDVADYTLTIDASDWEFSTPAVTLRTIKSDSGTLCVKGDVKLTVGKVSGNAVIDGDLTVNKTLDFDGGNLHVKGNCTTGASLIMKKPKDYLRVDGDLTLNTSSYDPMEEDHLSAGTVELKGNLYGNSGGYQRRVYRESGTHRTILSGSGIQTVSLSGTKEDQVLQVCLRNPDVNISSAYLVRLMEDAYQNDISAWNIQDTLDFNGYQLQTQDAIDLSGSISGIKSKHTGALLQMTAKKDFWTDQVSLTITCTEPTEDSVYVIVAGYDSQHRMVAAKLLTFTAKGELTQTLFHEDLQSCAYTKVFCLEDNLTPFCNTLAVNW